MMSRITVCLMLWTGTVTSGLQMQMIFSSNRSVSVRTVCSASKCSVGWPGLGQERSLEVAVLMA